MKCSTETKAMAKVEGLRLPQFTTKRKVDFEFNVFKKGGDYDLFLGRDFAAEFGIILDYKSKMFAWDGVEIPMMPRGYWNDEKINDFHEECKAQLKEEANKTEILDAKYEKIDVEEVIENQNHLDSGKKNQLKELIHRQIEAFKGLRGSWKGKPIEIELVEGAKPYFSKPYKIPKAYEPVTRKESLV